MPGWLEPLLKFLLIVLCGVTVLYLVAANAFLWMGGLTKVLATTDDIHATLRRGWTFWPGEVYVRDLRLTFQDQKAQWSLDLPRAKVCVQLFELSRRVFHAKCVQGEGMVFRVRHRVQPEDAKRPHVAALAPIPEFETPALLEATVPKPPRRNPDLWTVHLENVDVGLREVWAQQFRYLGRGRARGAFRLHAGNSLWVKPASLELEPGRLLAGDIPVAQRFNGRIGAHVDYFEILGPQGRQVFEEISADLRLHGREVQLDAATLFIDPKANVRVDSGLGTLEIALEVKRGVIDPHSVIAIENERVTVERPPFTVHLNHPALELSVKPDEHGQVQVTALSASLERQARPGAGVTSGVMAISLENSSRDTAAGWSLLRGELEVPELEVPDLNWFRDEFPAGLEPLRGAARASLRARYAPENFRADLAGDVRQLELALGNGENRGLAALAHTRLNGRLELGKERRRLAVGLGAEQAELRGPLPERALRAGAKSLKLSAELAAEGSEARGSLQLAAKSARGRLGKSPFSADLDAKLALPSIDLEQRSARGSGRLSVRNGALRAGSYAVAGWWADVNLGGAELSFARGVRARTAFDTKLRDGAPLLTVLAAEGELPRWVERILPLNEIEVSGQLSHRCHVTELLIPQASGGLLEGSGRLVGTKGGTQAAFLLQLEALNPLSAGVSMGTDDSGVSPLAGEDWLDEHVSRLVATARAASRCE